MRFLFDLPFSGLASVSAKGQFSTAVNQEFKTAASRFLKPVLASHRGHHATSRPANNN
jgi:hypothetical protein